MACGPGRAFVCACTFVWAIALVLVLVACVSASGFVSLSNVGPRAVLGLVAPRGVGFSHSRFGLVLVVRAVVSFYYPSVRRPVFVFLGKNRNSRCILFVFR